MKLDPLVVGLIRWAVLTAALVLAVRGGFGGICIAAALLVLLTPTVMS